MERVGGTWYWINGEKKTAIEHLHWINNRDDPMTHVAMMTGDNHHWFGAQPEWSYTFICEEDVNAPQGFLLG
jgi:hypothetical protein